MHDLKNGRRYSKIKRQKLLCVRSHNEHVKNSSIFPWSSDPFYGLHPEHIFYKFGLQEDKSQENWIFVTRDISLILSVWYMVYLCNFCLFRPIALYSTKDLYIFRWLIFSFSVIVFIVEKMGAEVEQIEEYSHYLAYISFVSSEQFMIIVGGHYFFREDLMKVIKEGGGKIGGVFGMRLSDDLRVKKITMHTRFKRETPTRPPTALQKHAKNNSCVQSVHSIKKKKSSEILFFCRLIAEIFLKGKRREREKNKDVYFYVPELRSNKFKYLKQITDQEVNEMSSFLQEKKSTSIILCWIASWTIKIYNLWSSCICFPCKMAMVIVSHRHHVHSACFPSFRFILTWWKSGN